MCWNPEVSLNTFIFSTFGAFFALINHYDWKIVLFVYLFSSMQFVEYMLWNNLKNIKLNELWSKVAFALIVLQPYSAINLINQISLRNLFFGIYTLILAIFLPSLIKETNFITSVGENKHLSWEWLPTNIIYHIVWLFFFIVPLYISKYYISVIFTLVTYLISYYLYNKTNTMGSMWCWIVTFSWLYIIGESFGLKKCLFC